MKAPALWFALVLATGLSAAEVRPGASLAEVKSALGWPRGEVQAAGRQVLYYERGMVELQEGTVTRVALRSAEEHAMLAARQERQRGEWETRRAQMMAEGSALRDRKLADPTFLAAPPAYQVAFWEDFVRRYPEISCVEPLTIARLRLSAQYEDERQQDERADRMAAIEEQFAAAERRPVFYPLFTSSRYNSHRHHRHRPFGLGPITYTFYDKPLPPYTTPSGNPAGSLNGGSIFNLKASNPALPRWSQPEESRWDRGYRPERQSVQEESRWDSGHGSGRHPTRGFVTGSRAFRGRS